MKLVFSLPKMTEIFNLILFILNLGCMCKDMSTADGYGNCQKDLGCYVEQPSSCNDLELSYTIPGEKWSYQACSQKGNIFLNALFLQHNYNDPYNIMICTIPIMLKIIY